MTTVGTLASGWRAGVGPWGEVVPADSSAPLAWWVAADDRWHTPATEPTVRQRLLRGAPVVETALRVPGGDALHRAYAVAGVETLLVVEVENASDLPFAVAFSRADLLTTRPPTAVPVVGIDLPAGAVVLPVAHRATVRVALAERSRAGLLPEGLASAAQVASGWVAQTERGVRLEPADDALAEQVVAARAALLLDGPAARRDDAAGFLLGAAELVRLGDAAGAWVDDVVVAAESLARAGRRAGAWAWDERAALEAAAEVLAAAGEARGAADARRLVASAEPVTAGAAGGGGPAELPVAPPGEPARLVAWAGRRLVWPCAEGADLAPVAPEPGRNVAAYRVPVPLGHVGFALRWHGPRAALLWDCSTAMRLRCPGLDPSWSTTEPRGEVLLAPAD